jgi:hypothetical protein
MIMGAEFPQWKVKVRCQKQNEKSTGQGKGATVIAKRKVPQIMHTEVYRHQCDAHGTEKLQHRGGKKRHSQHPHGLPTVVGRELGHPGAFRPAAVEELQSGESLKDVQKMGAQPRQGLEVALTDTLGAHAHQDHEQRDQGCGKGQQQTGRPAEGQDESKDGNRNHHGQSQLRQVKCEKVLQGFHLLQESAGQTAGPLVLGVGRTAVENVVDESPARLFPHAGTGLETGRLAPPGQNRPYDDHPGRSNKQRCQQVARQAIDEDTLDDVGQQTRLSHQQQSTGHTEDDRQQHPEMRRTGALDEPAQTVLIARCAKRFHGKTVDNDQGLILRDIISVEPSWKFSEIGRRPDGQNTPLLLPFKPLSAGQQ